MNRALNFGIPPFGVRCQQTANGWIVSATTRSCFAPFPLAFMSAWSYLAFGWMFASKASPKPITPGLAAVTISLAVFSLFFWWVALMGVLGKVEVRLDGDEGQVFTGFACFGRTRRFKRSEITNVFETNRGDEPEIMLEGRKNIRFGSWLSRSRRQYMVEVLSRLLLEE